MADRADHVVEYALAAYALPAQSRTTQDWRQIHQLACALEGRDDVAVPVHFLGLWDTVKVPGTPRLCEDDWLGNVVSGRHAVAIDGGSGPFGECRIGRGRRHHRRSLVPRRTLRCRRRPERVLAAGRHHARLDARRCGQGGRDHRRPRHAAHARTDRSATHSPKAPDRCASARCPRTRSCMPASTCTCARIPTTGAGCRAHVVWSDLDWAARAERTAVCPGTRPSAKAEPTNPLRTCCGRVVDPNAVNHGLIRASRTSRYITCEE